MILVIFLVLILLFLLLILGKSFKRKKVIQSYSVQNFIHLHDAKDQDKQASVTLIDKVNEYFEDKNDDLENGGDSTDSSDDFGDE